MKGFISSIQIELLAALRCGSVINAAQAGKVTISLPSDDDINSHFKPMIPFSSGGACIFKLTRDDLLFLNT